MKNKTIRFASKVLAVCALFVCLCTAASAQAYNAAAAKEWLSRFAVALNGLTPVNDPVQTLDPARPGEYLYEYAFGTVTAAEAEHPGAESIQLIDVRTEQVTDCRGMRVGMRLEDVMPGIRIEDSASPLYVLDMVQEGPGWSWVYLSNGEIYGIECIAYGTDGIQMTEYTLTYVIESGEVSAIRMKMAPATLAQAQEALLTVGEIASRQHGETMAFANTAAAFSDADNLAAGSRVLGAEVAQLVARLGEPQQIQTLPEGGGRILVYADAAVTLALDVRTGMEVVRALSVSGETIEGPRGLMVGLSVQEAASLFRCDRDVSSLGGALYLEGEAYGDVPCGILTVSGAGDMRLHYACLADGQEIVLEVGIRDGAVSYWRLYYAQEEGKL